MNRGVLLVFAIYLMTSTSSAQAPVRVACVGDSITCGDQLADRKHQSYPAVLQRLSQGRYSTGNFGVNATTALNTPFRAWTGTAACREALAFNPGIVVVMLGINDLAYPDLHAQYPADLRAIVARFQSLPSAPRVYLCTLTPIAPEDQQTHANRIIRETMIPAIRAVAAETGAGLIDIHAAFPNRIELLPDGLHPSPEGAAIIARTVLAALDAIPARAPQIQPAPVSGPVDISIRNEARAAKGRAEHWLQNQPPPVDLRDPATVPNAAGLLPLLGGDAAAAGGDFFLACAVLALELERSGAETVFLPDGSPVAWRAALLHQLVQRQRIDPTGGGYWSNPEAEDPVADSVRSTTHALQAIATALGE